MITPGNVINADIKFCENKALNFNDEGRKWDDYINIVRNYFVVIYVLSSLITIQRHHHNYEYSGDSGCKQMPFAQR